MPARSVCLVTLSLSEAGPGLFGRQASVTDIYHAMPCHAGIQARRGPLCLDVVGTKQLKQVGVRRFEQHRAFVNRHATARG